jgi:hypothetical protein
VEPEEEAFPEAESDLYGIEDPTDHHFAKLKANERHKLVFPHSNKLKPWEVWLCDSTTLASAKNNERGQEIVSALLAAIERAPDACLDDDFWNARKLVAGAADAVEKSQWHKLDVPQQRGRFRRLTKDEEDLVEDIKAHDEVTGLHVALCFHYNCHITLMTLPIRAVMEDGNSKVLIGAGAYPSGKVL